MALLQEWRDYAYSEEMQNSKEGQKLWENYFALEQGIYEKLLANPAEVVEGTVQEIECNNKCVKLNGDNDYYYRCTYIAGENIKLNALLMLGMIFLLL